MIWIVFFRWVFLGPAAGSAIASLGRRYAAGLTGLFGPSGFTSFRPWSGALRHPFAALGRQAKSVDLVQKEGKELEYIIKN